MIASRWCFAISLILMMQVSTASAASIVTEWLDQALPYAQEVAWEPTVGARFFAILHTAMYDAWTAYDPIAVGVVSGTTLKGRGGANNEANKREAISQAAFTVLQALAPQHRHALIERMQELGYDPNADTLPATVGRRAALAVLANRRDDGANEAGNFADTAGYEPRTSGPPDAWEPIESLGKRQLPTTPQWSRVMPFSLARADQFRPVPPPQPGTVEWSRQIEVLIKSSGALTDGQKAAVEYWGIWGMNPVPQLIEMTKFVSDMNDLRLDDDIRLFFVVSNAILDASIATWDAKYFYDYVRPITAIRVLGDRLISAWRPRSLSLALAYSTPAGLAETKHSTVVPGGLGEERAADWQPYLPTPPFPSYVSGHSAFTAAWARAMELATGKPDFNFKTTVRRLYVEQRELAQPITLFYPTFAAAAEASGISRIWAGVHWPADDERGQELGRKVGENAWRRAEQFLLGTASPPTAVFATLSPPFWFHENETLDHPAQFEAGSGLAVDLPRGGAGVWRSSVVDPMPAGTYELKFKAKVTGDQPIRLKVAIEPSERSQVATLSATEAMLPGAGSDGIVTIPWTSDGIQSFRVCLDARADGGSARLLVSAIKATRMWPTVAGSPRYYEPSTVGRPDQ
jgi:membrane-associated phospholipid phosphatase